MSAPSTPANFYVQQANGVVYASWDLSAGATSYIVQRSTDNVSFSVIATVTATSYLDAAALVGVQYYYNVAASNGVSSPATASIGVVPTATGQWSLGALRLAAQQRADRVGSNFVSLPEWNSYINQSATELYDLLVTQYEDYYLAAPYTITADGVSQQYALPANFYKLMGVDLQIAGASNAYISLHKFDFIERNRYIYPGASSSSAALFSLRYRLLGNTIFTIPAASSGQTLRVWFIPRLPSLLQDTDTLDGIDGWTEYVICDAAIKALQKEESDVSVLMAQKAALVERIHASATNRDAGQPDTISATRISGYTGDGEDGSFGGY